MRLACFMPVHNEADILPWTIGAMRREGCEVHVLDGWSTDGSFEIARDLASVEHFPAAGDDGLWSCERTLLHIEDLAVASGADWCLLSDADEIRVSPFPGDRLIDAVQRANEDGFNVVDFRVISFQPVNDAYRGDPEQHFRYYTEDPAIDGVCRPQQEKCWRNDCRVDIHSYGGHKLERPNKLMYPERLLMKHYPFRTLAQARRKLAARLGRRDKREHTDYGWGVHYDGMDPTTVIRDKATLKEWRS